MGSNKRRSDSVEESDNPTEDSVPKKKLKKYKKKQQTPKAKVAQSKEPAGANASSSNDGGASIKPMERKKKRKALDKKLHRKETDSGKKVSGDGGASKVIVAAVESEAGSSGGGGGGMPQFHVDVFKDLASLDGPVREAAAERLVMELVEVQKAYERRVESGEGVESGLSLEAEKDDGLNDCAPSVRYALRRLVRGTSSSRECARQGFALALTVLVGTIRSIKVESLLKLIVDLLEVSSSMKGQEVKDCFLGRLFAYGALSRSGRLTVEVDKVREFIGALISLASKKRYLQEPAGAVILELVEKFPLEAVQSHILVAPGLPEWFEGAIEIGNPDALLLALKIQEKFGGGHVELGKILPHPFSPSKLFSSDHLSSLANCLKESTFCQPRVHSVWPVLVNILVSDVVRQSEDLVPTPIRKHRKGRKSSSSEEETAKSIQNFLEVIVEGSLLSSSHDRKHLAFDILLLLLPKLVASFVSIVISYKLVQCLMDILSTKESWLYKVSQQFLKELLNWVGDDDVRRVAVLVALQKHSNGKFDSITKTKTVKTLLSEFKTESGCLLFIQDLVNMFVDEGQSADEPSDQSQTTDDNSEIGSVEDKDPVGVMGNLDYLKVWVVESLPSILKYVKLDAEAKYRVQKEVLKFLAVQGLFTSSLGSEVTSFELQEKFRWPKSATSTAICKMCIQQIKLLLASAQKGEVHPETFSDLGSYFMRFLNTLRNIPSVSLFRSLSSEDERALEELQEMETRLCREAKKLVALGDDNPKLHSLRYLLVQMLLQVLLQPGEFTEAVTELIICCKKAFPASYDLDSPKDDELDDDENPNFMDVLVDTLISLLPQSSASLQSTIEQVFKYFCNDVTSAGLLRMLRIIKKDLKPARHQEADSEDEDDDEEDFIDIEEDEEEIDEVETDETREKDEHTDDSEAIGEVEKTKKEDSEDSEDSDEGMDDDAMFRMDTYLAQIVKEKKNQAGGETAQSQLVLFKLRVLSLLEIYLHEHPGNPQVLTIYSNLAQALVTLNTTENSEQLGQRVWGILQKKIFQAKDLPKGEGVELSILESLLEKSLKLASKPLKRKKSAKSLSKKKQSASMNRHKMNISLARNSTYWILKIIDAKKYSESKLEKVFEILKDALRGYFDSKRSQIKSEFFKEIFRRRPWVGHHLFDFILENCGKAKFEFRRVEALELVAEVLRTMVPSGTDESIRSTSKKILKKYLAKFAQLVFELATNMPEKQSRRHDVRKFCGKVFQLVSTNNLTEPFLKDMTPQEQENCQDKLGELFVNLKTGKQS